jgi:glyoxylase-like metal-dependent hydrolase (beta-lactamase superfamily II)
MNKYLLRGLLLTVLMLSAAWAQAREIKQLSGSLYLFREGAHNAVFLVTDEGVIATDPINGEAAAWLKKEIEQRFEQQIRYVIYSHSDQDHIAGGEVFADSATIIAHRNAAPIIAEGGHTAAPDIVFKRRMELALGGQRVVLHYFGKSHTDNVIVMEFPAERTIFVVDSISSNRLPYRTMNRWFMPEGIEFIRQVENLDYDVFVPGHGDPSGPAEVTRHREYLEALYLAVRQAKQEGLSSEQAQETIRLEEFSDLGRYDEWLGENIAGMYRIVD